MRRQLPEYPWLDEAKLAHSNVLQVGWRTLVEDCLREVDKVLGSSMGWLEFFEIGFKHGALDIDCGFHNCSDVEQEAIGEAYRASQIRSQATCMMCGAPGWLMAAPFNQVFPLCTEHGGSDNTSEA